ncbi:MAG: homoserine O-acetyltransferase [Chitinophagaceae bacterium]
MFSTYTYHQPFELESGHQLASLHLGYTSYGQLNEERNNVVWVFHALTANSDPAEWWPGLIGKDKIFDPRDYFIICVNMPGSCYGSIGPLEKNPVTGAAYFHQFPFFTIKDMVKSYQLLRKELGIQKIQIGIGGSMGGQQLLEWAATEPYLFENAIALATNAFHSAWGIAFNASQRLAIENDSTWIQNDNKAGINGMKTARAIALLSYRNYETYKQKQSEEITDKITDFKSETYQQYQGAKLALRFNAFSYYFLSRSMDSHHLGRHRKNVSAALSNISAKTLILSISSDILFPPEEQRFLSENIPNAVFQSIHSSYGHDGFLLEFEQIEKAIIQFLNREHIQQNKFQNVIK